MGDKKLIPRLKLQALMAELKKKYKLDDKDVLMLLEILLEAERKKHQEGDQAGVTTD